MLEEFPPALDARVLNANADPRPLSFIPLGDAALEDSPTMAIVDCISEGHVVMGEATEVPGW